VLVSARLDSSLQLTFCSSAAPQWFAGIGTLVLAVVALFQQWLQRLLFHPHLLLKARLDSPDAELTKWFDNEKKLIPDGEVYYFRLAVRNVGYAAAHDVQVYLARIERKEGDEFKKVKSFTPLNLKWTHLGRPTRPVLLADMPPVYCDLGHVTNPKGRNHPELREDLEGVPPDEAILALDLEVRPATKAHLLCPGTYRFILVLAAANCKPRYYALNLVLFGSWSLDSKTMFRTGFTHNSLEEVPNPLPKDDW
jgi:hypothetical protein